MGQTIKRQLDFPANTYQNAEEVMASENKRLNKITRVDKIHLKDFLPTLVGDGLSFREGKVYIPDDLKDGLSDDLKQKHAHAEKVVHEFLHELLYK